MLGENQALYLDPHPDPHLFKTLDPYPDPHLFQTLDPYQDPHEMHAMHASTVYVH